MNLGFYFKHTIYRFYTDNAGFTQLTEVPVQQQQSSHLVSKYSPETTLHILQAPSTVTSTTPHLSSRFTSRQLGHPRVFFKNFPAKDLPTETCGVDRGRYSLSLSLRPRRSVSTSHPCALSNREEAGNRRSRKKHEDGALSSGRGGRNNLR